MLDWEGLLKFSLKYSDGTKKSDFQQMKVQDKKFLEEVLDYYCNADIRRVQQLIKYLNENQDSSLDKINVLEQLQQLLDSLDKGSVLYQLQAHIPLLKIVFYSKVVSNKIIAMQILASANQNDVGVQNECINVGALQLTELIQKQSDNKVRQTMMGTISALIRGENLEAKRIFIRIKGLQLLKALLIENCTQRLRQKINNLIRDLLYYDDYLHQTYKDLTAFSNTAGLKKDKNNHELSYDVNEEAKKQNFKPEHEKYKGKVKQFLGSNPEIKNQYEVWLKAQQSS